MQTRTKCGEGNERGVCNWDSRKSSSGSSRNSFSCDTKVLIICVVGVGEFSLRTPIVFSQQLDLCWRSFVHSFIHSFIPSFIRLSLEYFCFVLWLFYGSQVANYNFLLLRLLPTVFMQGRVGGGGTKKIINKNKVNQKKFMFPGNQQNLML